MAKSKDKEMVMLLFGTANIFSRSESRVRDAVNVNMNLCNRPVPRLICSTNNSWTTVRLKSKYHDSHVL